MFTIQVRRVAVVAVAALTLVNTHWVLAEQTQTGATRILLFSKTSAFRHGSIDDARNAITQAAVADGMIVDATEDAGVFNTSNLAPYAAVVFMLTSGNVLDADQQGAFEDYIRGGNGYAGIHSASDTEYDWPWYGDLIGAWFDSHPSVQQATQNVEISDHPSTEMLPPVWVRTDEWYNFRSNPRSSVNVLLTLDESTYSGGNMGADHPIAWYHDFDGGRSFYTAGGHRSQAYGEAEFVAHILGGIRYAAGLSASADADGDGVPDASDNCSLVANPAQRDTNGDGFGNLCDADLNNDCVVNAEDLGILRQDFFSTGDLDADFDGDGAVNTADLGVLREQFFGAPGPAGGGSVCLP